MALSTAAKARLNNPGEHYPYKLRHVLGVLEENAAAGPNGPDDDRANVRDFMSEDIARASDAMIKAQAEYVASQADEARVAYVQARAALVEARQKHRANRPNGPTVTAVRSPL